MKKITFPDFPENAPARAEAVQTLCGNLLLSLGERKILLLSGEESGWLGLQILCALSDRGVSAVLVDADLRQSRLRPQGVQAGLLQYLSGQCDLDDALYAVSRPGVCVTPAGGRADNPVSLLTQGRLSGLLSELSRRFDLTLVAAPPAGPVADAAEIARACQCALLAAVYGKTRGRDLAEAREQIERTGCPVIGCALTGVSFRRVSARKYYQRSLYARLRGRHFFRR